MRGETAGKFLKREKLTASPAWFVRYGGESHIFNGEPSIERYLSPGRFPVTGTASGAKVASRKRVMHNGGSDIFFPDGAVRRGRDTVIKAGKLKGSKPQIKYRAITYRREEDARLPVPSEADIPAIAVAEIANCVTQGVRRIPINAADKAFSNLDVTFYAARNERNGKKRTAQNHIALLPITVEKSFRLAKVMRTNKGSHKH